MLTLQTSQTLTFGLAQNWRQNPKFYHIPSYSHIFPYIPQHVHHVSPGEIQDHPKVCAFALVLLLYFSAAHSSCERSLAWCHGWSFVKFVDINFWLSILVSRCSCLVLQPQTFISSQLNTLGTWTCRITTMRAPGAPCLCGDLSNPKTWHVPVEMPELFTSSSTS